MAATGDMSPAAGRALAIVTDRIEGALARRGGLIAEAVRRGAVVHVIGPQAPQSHADALRAVGAETHSISDLQASGPLGARTRRRAIEAVLDRLAPSAALTMGPLAALPGAAATARTGVGRIVVDGAGLGAGSLGLGPSPSWFSRQRARASLARAAALILDNVMDERTLAPLGLVPPTTRILRMAAGGADTTGTEAAPLPPTGPQQGAVALLVATGSSVEQDRAELALYRRACERARIAMTEAAPARAAPEFRVFGESDPSTLPWAWAEAMAEAHVVVIAGAEPAMPQALVDALALGRPVIAARAPDRHLLIDEHVNGAMFEPGDAEDLARALILMLARPAELAAMARASRLKAERHLDRRPINGELLEILGFPPRSG